MQKWLTYLKKAAKHLLLDFCVFVINAKTSQTKKSKLHNVLSTWPPLETWHHARKVNMTMI